jgi:signal transduction histidine kinase
MGRIDQRRVVAAVAALAACAAAALALFAIPTGEGPLTYRAAAPAAHLIGPAAGCTLIVVALLTARRAVGVLLLALATAWFGQDLAALGDDQALLRAVAFASAPFAGALVLHLALCVPDARLSRTGRAMVAAAYAIAAGCAIGTLVTRDPFLDVYCWRQCSDNSLLAHADPGVAHAFVVAGLVASIAAGVAAAAVAALRVATTTRVARVLLAPALAGVAITAAGEAARGSALVAVPLEDPGRPGFMAVYLLRAGALIVLAAGIGWIGLRARMARARVTRLATELGATPAPGKLKDALAHAFGDPTVDVLYWVPAVGGFVDRDGAPCAPVAGTQIRRGDRLLAVVVHENAALSGEELERLLGPAARLAIENEALRAEVLAQLAQLRESRARTVATADESRRRLERDLHDGAQQRLLAVVLDLRLARAGAPDSLAERLGVITEEVDRAFNDLRELAHGIYPAVLSEAGLEAALPTLAERAPVVVNLGNVTAQRLSAPVEAGAYITVDEAIRDAAKRCATAVSVTATVHDDRLVVSASDDGTPRETSLVHVADRVGALGGTVELAPTLLQAEIPCA